MRYALRNATTVLAVDGSLEKRAVDLARYPGGNITCLPTGYDGAVWVPSGTKERRVLTVAKCTDVLKMRIKGVDVIFDCARSMPDVPFTVIGLAPKLLRDAKAQAPANAEIIPLVEQRELLEHYQRAKVYCQPSYIEGLPNSLCEAMLCECVPVGTDVAGIPTVMDGLGFLVKYGDVQGLAGAIRKALDEPASTGERARARISENFSLQKRESALVSLIAEGAE